MSKFVLSALVLVSIAMAAAVGASAGDKPHFDGKKFLEQLQLNSN